MAATVIACCADPQKRLSVMPGHRLRPAGEQRRQSTDRVVVTGEDAVAGDHVVDLDRVEPDACRQRPEALGEQLLRMDVVQRAVGAPLAAGRADHVDDPRVGHSV